MKNCIKKARLHNIELKITVKFINSKSNEMYWKICNDNYICFFTNL